MIEKKDIYKQEMVQRLSIIKLCYIFKMIVTMDKTRATSVDPSRFKDKKEILCKALEQGWEIKKVDSKSYLLKRKKPSKK